MQSQTLIEKVCLILEQLVRSPLTLLLVGLPLGDSHRAHLINSPILFQEIHAIVFTARSIKSIDLTNVLVSLNPNAVAAKSIEVLRPVLMLLRSHLCRCESIIISGNPLSSYDIGELGKSPCFWHRCTSLTSVKWSLYTRRTYLSAVSS